MRPQAVPLGAAHVLPRREEVGRGVAAAIDARGPGPAHYDSARGGCTNASAVPTRVQEGPGTSTAMRQALLAQEGCPSPGTQVWRGVEVPHASDPLTLARPAPGVTAL